MTKERYTLHHGDSLVVLASMPANSVDSIVCDPPYELGFMGKAWDKSGIANDPAMWAECLRVLKPGGHLLAFSGSRTYHRMACAIEDAGFELRDQIMWVYATGFPKSMDVSKAIDKAAGATREVVGVRASFRPNANATRDPEGFQDRSNGSVTAPATDEAKQWDGWGTALKPAHEPICVARKPLDGTVASNVLTHGTGALNIDGCRIETSDSIRSTTNPDIRGNAYNADVSDRARATEYVPSELGRWPSNLLHDGSPEVRALFPDSKGQRGAVTGNEPSSKTNNVYGKFEGRPATVPRVDLDTSAARFFYCPKASTADRHEGLQHPGAQFKRGTTLRKVEVAAAAGELSGNTHPTVKPTELMAYLCRLVTPPGGTVLDPFCGSGSTGKAAMREGFNFIGIELDAAYLAIADARIKFELLKQEPAPEPEAPLADVRQLDLLSHLSGF
jgi:site-specific DNA-methyltransferase (adenine-specific)